MVLGIITVDQSLSLLVVKTKPLWSSRTGVHVCEIVESTSGSYSFETGWWGVCKVYVTRTKEENQQLQSKEKMFNRKEGSVTPKL